MAQCGLTFWARFVGAGKRSECALGRLGYRGLPPLERELQHGRDLVFPLFVQPMCLKELLAHSRLNRWLPNE